ncbi:hypothetical protein E2C01_005685 [Portunus trituberculatus]|uniref:Uncharacterized protein n=1 Tax=Portunus trituberculatus TaxID=210409 RepID=A0A5B7CU54_PORTR|nr:hypothetical protein [Portunus trituberculatus]
MQLSRRQRDQKKISHANRPSISTATYMEENAAAEDYLPYNTQQGERAAPATDPSPDMVRASYFHHLCWQLLKTVGERFFFRPDSQGLRFSSTFYPSSRPRGSSDKAWRRRMAGDK